MTIPTIPPLQKNLSNNWEAEEKKRNIKFFQTQYTKIKIGGSFGEDWASNLENFEDLFDYFGIEEMDRKNFLRYMLK